MTFPWSDGSDIAFTPVGVPKTQVCELLTPAEKAALPKEDQQFDDDEVDRLLSGDLSPLGLTADGQALTADGDDQTGAMIALLPTIADQERLAVPGGEDEEELHLTLLYLGEAAKITPDVRDSIVRMMGHLSQQLAIVDADGFAVSTFNPEKPNMETCVTLGCSGAELARVHKRVAADLADGIDMTYWPEQHVPWIPHITLAYSNDSSLAAQLTDRTGPIRFDVLRVAFAGEVTDFPLYDGTAKVQGVDTSLVSAGGKESDVNKPGGNHNLKDYWVHGAGAAKIGWGTDGSFARCVALLGKHVKNPQGLCAEYHHAATGEWPAEKGVESAVDIAVTADAGSDDDYDGGWIGPLAVEDSDTGDGRMFSGGSLTWGDTTETIHPFQWAPANLGAHQGSVTAGRINKIWRDPTNPRVIMGKGTFNLNDEDGIRAFNQVRDGYAGGVSIDPDQIADADVELEFATEAENPLEAAMAKPTKTIFHAGRIRGATLVAFPALVEAAIKLTRKSDAVLTASVTSAPWSALQYEMRLGEEIDGLVAAAAFAHVRDIDDVVSRRQCRFLHHEINEDGTAGLANLVACAAHIDAINGGRTFGLTRDELFQSYSHMAQHIMDAGQSPAAFTIEADAVVASGAPDAPPLEWFGDPKLSGPTPVSVTDDGRVFGHAAAWNSCHTGFPGACVSPPMESDYGYFTTGEVLTAEGHRVAVGQITLGTSHAATSGVSLAKAIDHYGDTGTAVADVSAGTDEHGIWIAGAVRPSATVEHVHALRASALSGDWRRIGGNLRMVALLAVNVPGFPIPRLSTNVTSGKQLSLVASGIVDHNAALSFDAEIALLAGDCGIPLGKKKEKYESIEAELTALADEVFDVVDAHGNKHSERNGKFTGHVGKGGGGGKHGTEGLEETREKLKGSLKSSERERLLKRENELTGGKGQGYRKGEGGDGSKSKADELDDIAQKLKGRLKSSERETLLKRQNELTKGKNENRR